MLVLAPSLGLGGGIERYVHGVVLALRATGRPVHRLNLRTGDGGLASKVHFLLALVRAELARPGAAPVFVMHPGLLPAAYLVTAARRRRLVAVFYGSDIYRASRAVRWLTVRSRRVEPMSISAFSVALVSSWGRPCRLLPAALEPAWLTTLQEARRAAPPRDIDVLSVFRLDHWRAKGAEELLESASRLRLSQIVIAGRGPAPAGLIELAHRHGARVIEDPSGEELAALYARAQVFALATRSGGAAGVEGLGLVLVEAQVAGAVVVAPSGGGSGDAFVAGVTGIRAADESVAALIAALQAVRNTPAETAAMGRAGVAWAERHFTVEALAARLEKELQLPLFCDQGRM